ncbi:MAG: hypothetical protein LKJ55_03670 [[Lactobacillus] timonensis]|nr:hypothetical protein [[Lactobacillus] timonensis]MCI1970451.1 hypothetical protein [[Lactobacillus] timonensis]
MVIANYFKNSISNAAHESSRKDLQDLNDKLTDFKMNVSELSSLLKQLNKDVSKLARRVDQHDHDMEQIKIDIAKIKEKIGVKDDDNHH